ncbi:hypothetical protein ACH5RR_013957 [Cinchona calisaya]|uniref:Uncharacterized protein n=1 Tax=Cinchona calisaya TaxID=153742 RepID=A0ABD3A4X4_9GENT
MSTKNKKADKEGKFSRCIKAPIRILTKARDLYIKSMSDCATNVEIYSSYGAIGCPTPHVATSLPKSFSVRSSSASRKDDDLAELTRIASTRSVRKNKVELEILRRQNQSTLVGGGVSVVPRSHTVAFGRIDEEKPCDFGDSKLKTDHVFVRSGSHVVIRGRVF